MVRRSNPRLKNTASAAALAVFFVAGHAWQKGEPGRSAAGQFAQWSALISQLRALWFYMGTTLS